MENTKIVPVEEKELQMITKIYKELQDSNRNLWLMNGNVLLASQDAHMKKRGRPSKKVDN